MGAASNKPSTVQNWKEKKDAVSRRNAQRNPERYRGHSIRKTTWKKKKKGLVLKSDRKSRVGWLHLPGKSAGEKKKTKKKPDLKSSCGGGGVCGERMRPKNT